MNYDQSLRLDFIVGEEKRLADIISRREIEPLLASFVAAGLYAVTVRDEDNLPLAFSGGDDSARLCCNHVYSLLVEGEPKGTVTVDFLPDQDTRAATLAVLARDTLQLIISNNLKRMMTTEMHTTIVHESYEQLIENNSRLKASEGRYRDLACSLESQVEERTLKLQQAYGRMLQQEKLAAVGSLAAGMAHEINNPNGFVRSNISTFGRYFERMKEALDRYQLLIASNTPLLLLQQESDILRKKLKLDFISADVSPLLEQSLEGCDRIASIIASLKSFSHVDESGEADANLNNELDNLLAVLEPQLPEDGQFIRNFSAIPLFPCNPGQLSQSFYNILHNAMLSRGKGLEIMISTQHVNGEIVVTIADNGCGIPETELSRIFEPFYTTREVGKGTGVGLTVARDCVQGVGGTVEITSVSGTGTTVTIHLPLLQV